MMHEKISRLDEALFALSTLSYRSVLKELAQLARMQIKALSKRGLRQVYFRTRSRMMICSLSPEARAVLEAALKEPIRL